MSCFINIEEFFKNKENDNIFHGFISPDDYLEINLNYIQSIFSDNFLTKEGKIDNLNKIKGVFEANIKNYPIESHQLIDEINSKIEYLDSLKYDIDINSIFIFGELKNKKLYWSERLNQLGWALYIIKFKPPLNKFTSPYSICDFLRDKNIVLIKKETESILNSRQWNTVRKAMEMIQKEEPQVKNSTLEKFSIEKKSFVDEASELIQSLLLEIKL